MKRPNVIVIVVDSLRADRVPPADGVRNVTPFTTGLVREGALFERFVTPVNATIPALTCLHTGQRPLTHGVLHARFPRSLKAVRESRARPPSFAQLLRNAGWATAAFDELAVKHPWVGAGFEHRVDLRRYKDHWLTYRDFNPPAIAWMREQRQPFFLYVRYCEPHEPYDALPDDYRFRYYEGDPTTSGVGSLDGLYRSPFAREKEKWLKISRATWPGARGKRIEDARWLEAQYDAAVRMSDDGVAELAREAWTLSEDTIIVVLGDHGESFGEHGVYIDHHGLYAQNLRTACVVHAPRRVAPGIRVHELVETPDIAPTLLTLAGLPVPDWMDGRACLPEVPRDEDAGRLTVEASRMFKWAYRRDPYKLIVSRQPMDVYGMPRIELFDRDADPEELTDLSQREPQLREVLRAELEAHLQRVLSETGWRFDPLEALVRRPPFPSIRPILWKRRLRAAFSPRVREAAR